MAAETEDARSAIARAYHDLDLAIVVKDAAAYAKVFTPDAKIVASGLELGVIAFQATLSNMLAAVDEVAQESRIETIEVTGDTATVVARSHFRMVAKGPDGKPAVTGLLSSTRDSWVKTSDGWRLVKMVEISQQLLPDGIEPSAAAPLSTEAREAIAADLRKLAIPFASADASSSFDDLAFLDDAVGDARIVALGESSHGSSQQFRMKNRIIEHLVRQKGFTVVAFEANWSASGAVDNYVKGSTGSAAAALEQLGFWIWRTEEIRSLIEWMRAENLRRAGEKQLTFTGFDIQQLGVPSSCVLDVFAKLGGPDLAKLEELYRAGSSAAAPQSEKELKDLLAEIRSSVGEALAIVDGHRAELIAASSQGAFEKARQCARVIVQNADNLDAGLSFSVRDQAMADNVRWLADVAHPGEKIILWAQNGHVGALPGTMGGRLREGFGKDMVVLGFASHHGEIRAVPFKDGKIDGALYSLVGPVPMMSPKPAEGSVSDVLNAAGIPSYFLDFRKLPPTSALGERLATPQSETSVGWAYDTTKPNARSIVLPQIYDGIVFIAESNATTLLK